MPISMPRSMFCHVVGICIPRCKVILRPFDVTLVVLITLIRIILQLLAALVIAKSKPINHRRERTHYCTLPCRCLSSCTVSHVSSMARAEWRTSRVNVTRASRSVPCFRATRAPHHHAVAAEIPPRLWPSNSSCHSARSRRRSVCRGPQTTTSRRNDMELGIFHTVVFAV